MASLQRKFITLKGRMLPKARPKLSSDAKRVTIYAQAFNSEVPSADLALKYVASYTPFTGGYGELYAFCNKDDPEALMCVYIDNVGVKHFEVGRMAGTELNISVDGNMVKTFPRGSDVGYWGMSV